MTKIEKFLLRLVPKERAVAENLLERIARLDLEGLDVKKLKDMGGMYRVRKGDLRIKFYMFGKSVHILDINRRNDNTY